MVTRARPVEKLEEGDIFFFYRPRVKTSEVHGRADVQRFYMVLASERPRKFYRLLVVGRKKLPALTPGQHPERRNWALVVGVSRKPHDIRRELAAYEYDTETRGKRFVAAAKPLGEGRYMLLRHHNHTELAYALELPKHPGPAQQEFQIHEEASYIVAVKNPEVAVPGAPAPSRPPEYPPHLRDKFGAYRWIDAEPELLDYENTQVMLLAAHAEKDVETELGVHIPTEDEKLATAEVCRELRVRCEGEAVTPLLNGTFPDHEETPDEATEIETQSAEAAPTRGGRAGGRAAARRAPSVAAIARLLAGIHFPKDRDGLVRYARRHADRVDNPEEAIEVLRSLPDRTCTNMADVMSVLGEVR